MHKGIWSWCQPLTEFQTQKWERKANLSQCEYYKNIANEKIEQSGTQITNNHL